MCLKIENVLLSAKNALFLYACLKTKKCKYYLPHSMDYLQMFFVLKLFLTI